MRKRRNNKTKKVKSQVGYKNALPDIPAHETDDAYGKCIGFAICGFDSYGYPNVRSVRLPGSYYMNHGRKYAANSSMVQPMKLVAQKRAGQISLPKVQKFKLKPQPSVPAAPSDIPEGYKFCVHRGSDGYFYRFVNAKTSLHGAEADVMECWEEPSGISMCSVKMPGSERLYEAPLCEGAADDKESVPADCCVQMIGDNEGQLICSGSSYDLLIVNIVTTENVGGVEIASVEHPDLPGGGIRAMICEPVEDESPGDKICCIDENSGRVVCPEGISFPLDGQQIPMEYLEFVTDQDGQTLARLKCGSIDDIDPSIRAQDPTLDAMWSICEDLGGYVFLACEKRPTKRVPEIESKPLPPPPVVPDLCCYDPQTGKLVCEGTPLHGVDVELISKEALGNVSIVTVSLDGYEMRIPVCRKEPEIPMVPPASCCIIESTAGLVLDCGEGHPWHQMDVTGIGDCYETEFGRMCHVEIRDDYGVHTLEVPVCPELPEEEYPDSTPHLPPPFVRPPASESSTEVGAKIEYEWDEMQAKGITKCDQAWMAQVKEMAAHKTGPGHRYSSMEKDASAARRYGTGVAPDYLGYGRFPGVRGGRSSI